MDKSYLTRLLPFIIFFTGAVGFFFTDRPFSFERHELSDSDSTKNSSAVPARLWQDPFQAIEDFLQSEKDAASKSKSSQRGRRPKDRQWTNPDDTTSIVRRTIAKLETEAEPLSIMPIIITKTSYAEIKEWCTRSRYATITALESLGYEPEDNEHIGYFNFSLASAGSTIAVQIPYEWFTSDPYRRDEGAGQRIAAAETKKRHVLILWIPENLMNGSCTILHDDVIEWTPTTPESGVGAMLRVGHPATAIADSPPTSHDLASGAKGDKSLPEQSLPFSVLDGILRQLKPDIRALEHRGEEPGKRVPSTEIHVIANCSSTALRKFISDAPSMWHYISLPIVSARSTAIEQLLQNRSSDGAEDRGGLIHFVNPSDGQTLFSILLELKRRGVDLTGKNDLIAIVSEWDTFYGRSIPKTFCSIYNIVSRELGRNPGYLGDGRTSPTSYADIAPHLADALRELSDQKDVWPATIKKYTYMEGMDGEYPGVLAKADSTAKANKERAEGTSQFDYLRRLGRHMQDEQDPNGGPRFRAIGILGNNPTDKLLTLQALRPLFPDAIFFTTDLDCRLMEPDQQTWARNLVVSSGFRLVPEITLSESHERSYPPFRDSYQTSLFTAIRYAMKPAGDDAKAAPRTSYPTYMHEIGRGQAIELPIGPQLAKPAGHQYRSASFRFLAGMIAITLLGVVVWMASVRSYYENYRKLLPQNINYRYWYCTSALALPAILSIWLLSLMNEGIEPITITQGISVWPSLVIKVIVLYLSVLLFFISIMKLRGNDRSVERDYLLPGCRCSFQKEEGAEAAKSIPALHAIDPIIATIMSFAKRVHASNCDNIHDNYERCIIGSRVDSRMLWIVHKERSHLRYSWLRIALRFALLVIFIMVVMAIFPKSSFPHRDEGTVEIHKFIGYMLMAYFCTLSFFVIDTLSNFSQLIQTLVRKTTKWPECLLQTIKGQYGLTSGIWSAEPAACRDAARKSEDGQKLGVHGDSEPMPGGGAASSIAGGEAQEARARSNDGPGSAPQAAAAEEGANQEPRAPEGNSPAGLESAADPGAGKGGEGSAKCCDEVEDARDMEEPSEDRVVATLLDIRFIEKRTGAIESMIYYPIFLLLLMIIARNHFFSNLTWNWLLIFLNGIMLVWLLISAAVLVRSARNAKARAIETFNRLISSQSQF